jgi:membrane-bound lytic murein transglycosylase B
LTRAHAEFDADMAELHAEIWEMEAKEEEAKRAAAIVRTPQLAACLPLVTDLAAEFTEGEQAALDVTIDEIKQHGSCVSPISKLAARAGVSRTTYKKAVRKAQRLRQAVLQLEKTLTPLDDKEAEHVLRMFADAVEDGIASHRRGGKSTLDFLLAKYGRRQRPNRDWPLR